MNSGRWWEMGSAAALAVLGIGIVAGRHVVLKAKERIPPPSFSDYPVNATLTRHSTRERLKSGRRTSKRSAPANFAGHFRLETWGCGNECQSFSILDVYTGKQYSPPFALRLGADFRLTSNLFIADPPAAWRESYGKDLANAHHGPPVSNYYRWTGRSLVQLTTRRVTTNYR